MPEPDVTVVTPTRNRPALLERALASILRQSYQRYEVFVVDDGSDEEHAASYRALVDRFDDRFTLLQCHPHSRFGTGPSLARNRGIGEGSGRYIAFLDDDDVWTWEGHLATAIKALDDSGLEVYCADLQGFQGDTLVIDTWFPDRRPFLTCPLLSASPPIYNCGRGTFLEAARHRNLNPDPIVVSRGLVERAGGFSPTLWFAEDYEFLLRMVDNTQGVLFCDQPVARYRLPEQGSHSLSAGQPDQHLHSLAAAQHLRVTSRTPEVRLAARRVESWTLRTISGMLRSEGRVVDSVRFALQGFVVRPTAGGLRQLLASVLPAGRR